MDNLILGKDIRQPEFLSGIECVWDNVGRGQNVLEKETAALGSSRNKRDRLSCTCPFPRRVPF